MLTAIVAVAIVIVAYGLFWTDRPGAVRAEQMEPARTGQEREQVTP